MATLRIGTASWTDPGFVEDWYPRKLPASQRLRWYAEHFDYVEVNATFYAIPTAKTVERWCAETPPGFLFDVKLPKALSRHAMQPRFLPADLRSKVSIKHGKVELTPKTEELIVLRFLREIASLKESGKLGSLLLQLSPAFSPREHRLTELDSLRAHLVEHPLAVELRNRNWIVGTQFAETLDYFKKRELTLVLVDGPESEHFTVMPDFDEVTNPTLGYARLHGRNEQGYIKGRSVAERFDYDYPDNEVQEIAARLRRVSSQVAELHIVANNNRSNYAPKLAKKLQELLDVQKGLQKKLTERQGELL